MYNEFLDCNSYLYEMQEKEDTQSISSEGEFDEFKYGDLLDESDSRFVDD